MKVRGEEIFDSAFNNQPDLLEELLKDEKTSTDDINFQEASFENQTPLLKGCQAGYLLVAQLLLLDPRTNVLLCDNKCLSAIDLACLYNHPHVASRLMGHKEVFRTLSGVAAAAILDDMKQLKEQLRMALKKTKKTNTDGNEDIMAQEYLDLVKLPAFFACGLGYLDILKELLSFFPAEKDNGKGKGERKEKGKENETEDEESAAWQPQLMKGIRLMTWGSTGLTLMHVAALNGHLDVAQWLLNLPEIPESDHFSDYSSWDEGDAQERTPFYLACAHNRANVAELLLQHPSLKIDPQSLDSRGWSPFFATCKNGFTDVVKLLLKHRDRVDINAPNRRGWTPFRAAFHAGFNEIVQLLLSEPNLVVGDSWNPLLQACQKDWKEVIKPLVRQRFDHHAADECGYTPIALACKGGNLDMVSLLLQECHPVDINQPTNMGQFPIELALDRQYYSVVSLLLTQPNLDLRTKGPEIFHAFCCKAPKSLVAEFLELQPDAAKNVRLGEDGNSALYSAFKLNREEVVKLLLDHPAFELHTEEFLREPYKSFSIACSHSYVRIVEELLYRGNLDAHEIIVTLMNSTSRPTIFKLLLDHCENSDYRLAEYASGIFDQFAIKYEATSFKYFMLSHSDTYDYGVCFRLSPHITDVREYLEDPITIKKKWSKELGKDQLQSSKIFALCVLLSDGYVRIGNTFELTDPRVRYFQIMEQLPMDLQMVMCNRTFTCAKSFISVTKTNQAIRAVLAALSTPRS